MEDSKEQTAANIESLRNSGWKAAIKASDCKGYASISTALSTAARTAIENGQLFEGNSLRLLANACSMMLNPSSPNEPFKPLMVMNDGRRSSLPIDFQKSDINLLAEFVEEVDDPWLQARLADLLWLLVKPRSPKHALLAIDAYCKIPLDSDTWRQDGRECWARALRLSLMLNAADRRSQIEAAIFTAFNNAEQKDGFFALQLADLIALNRLGNDHRQPVAIKLEEMARAFDVEGAWPQSRGYFEAAATWHRKSNNVTKATEMTVGIAESWVKQGEQIHSQPFFAADFYEDAIQIYRRIPRNERNTYKVDERIAELHKRMNDAGAKSFDEMTMIHSPPVDISDIVKLAVDAVKGKVAIDALAAFANISQGERAADICMFSEKSIREYPLSALFAATHRSRDGRVIAKCPSMGFGNIESEEYKATVWAKMIEHYKLGLGLAVQSGIWPALEILRLEHRLREEDFLSIASNSPIVPIERERLWAKALFLGYDNDFVAALHILVPQVEHMVRWHLKSANVKTTNLDKEGIENENGLSTLMEIAEVSQIFGEDLAFELKALFCDAFGPNLRNQIAHGLLNDQECLSVYAVYAWWLGFRIVFNTFYRTQQQNP
ncbi:MAG: DUF4209 domain-containing protein [Candidatus Electronema sp. V4]|uniref:DUF4209 domain-containing protein n=1 Tax=Candidatus Electronema sp. V4 TaxID=3454756 RepID=UPI0040554A66